MKYLAKKIGFFPKNNAYYFEDCFGFLLEDFYLSIDPQTTRIYIDYLKLSNYPDIWGVKTRFSNVSHKRYLAIDSESKRILSYSLDDKNNMSSAYCLSDFKFLKGNRF